MRVFCEPVSGSLVVEERWSPVMPNAACSRAARLSRLLCDMVACSSASARNGKEKRNVCVKFVCWVVFGERQKVFEAVVLRGEL